MAIPIPPKVPYNFKDLTGQKFGKWSVIGYAGKNKRGWTLWTCQCDCGTIRDVVSTSLCRGTSTACGCHRKKGAQVIDPSGVITLKHGHICLVDPEDIPLVSQFRWHAHQGPGGHWYAVRSTPTPMKMHVFLMGRRGVDHKNGNGLDNRRENLRFATQSQNQMNTRKRKSSSKYKGVAPPLVGHRGKSWAFRITIDGKKKSFGGFATEEDAARAYDEKAKEVYGEFAWLNFPDGKPR